MKKIFVCLANSKKYSGRCVAGIELVQRASSFVVVSDQERPLWIRPVSRQEHGEVGERIVNHIALLDVVEIDVIKHVPQSYQSENFLFDHRTITVISRIEAHPTSIDNFLYSGSGMLFGNRGKAIPVDKVNELDHSLIFIKPEQTVFRQDRSSRGKDQLRVVFLFANVEYDLPVTDIDFVAKHNRNPNMINFYKEIYLTISLGLSFEGWHYKLVAGVVYC